MLLQRLGHCRQDKDGYEHHFQSNLEFQTKHCFIMNAAMQLRQDAVGMLVPASLTCLSCIWTRLHSSDPEWQVI